MTATRAGAGEAQGQAGAGEAQGQAGAGEAQGQAGAGEAQGPATSGRPRLRELDLLRFLAAMGVVAYHFRGKWSAEAAADHATVVEVSSYGNLGVQLFFLISGFVILMSVEGRRLGDFAASRFVRLMPAYWLSVVITGTLLVMWGQVPVGDVLTNLTMLQGPLGVEHIEIIYWTLWVEVTFYLLICFLVMAGTGYRNCLIFMGAWLFLAQTAGMSGNKLLEAVLIPVWSPYFIGGMACYLIYHGGRDPRRGGREWRSGSRIAPWAALVTCWILGLSFHAPKGPGAPFVVTAIFAVMALVATGKLSWLRWRGLVTLGALTYPLYLFHSRVGTYTVKWMEPLIGSEAAVAVAVAAALAVAYGVYRLVERPLQSVLKSGLRSSLTAIRRA